ncbi:gastrula zinc finger protein XlCGF49.1-like [Nylanderia fulva]|uniref:gastrula zinc finger protein XlCGF49.1-like n=1 Tax=Nylanderia fulva TaxID=613905 RepID=UPI0010FB23F4|nr:gastrula zinc finger protein XlCGF49.1-like [Nylanderia fulva]
MTMFRFKVSNIWSMTSHNFENMPINDPFKMRSLNEPTLFHANANDSIRRQIFKYGILMEELSEFKLNTSITRYCVSRGKATAPEEQHFVCGECGKGYKWMDNLRRHQRLECDNTELCDWLIEPLLTQEFDEDIAQSCFEFVTTKYEFPESPESMEHRRKKQLKITTLVCEECGKNFSRLDSLKRHEKLYCKVKSKPTSCPVCGKKFEKPLSLHNHIKSAHPSLVVKKEEPE